MVINGKVVMSFISSPPILCIQGQSEACCWTVHSVLLDQLPVGLHTELQEIHICFRPCRHREFGGSGRGGREGRSEMEVIRLCVIGTNYKSVNPLAARWLCVP